MEIPRRMIPEYWAEFMATGSADAYIRYRRALEDAEADESTESDEAP